MANEDNSWRTPSFRQNIVNKIDEAIQQSGTPTTRNSREMETHVFEKAKTREEYLGFVARLILHVREVNMKKGGMMNSGGGVGGGNMGGVGGNAQAMPDPINALQNLTRQGSGLGGAQTGGGGAGPGGPQQTNASTLLQTLNQRPGMQRMGLGPNAQGQMQGQMQQQMQGQMGNQMGQMAGQMQGQIPGQMQGQMPGQMSGQMGGQMPGQIVGQIPGQMAGQIPGQMASQIPGQIGGQMPGQMTGQMSNQMTNQMSVQMGNQMPNQISGSMGGPVGNQIPGQMAGQMTNQMGGPVGGQIPGQMAGQITNQMGGQVNAQMAGQLPGQIAGQMGGQGMPGNIGGQAPNQMMNQMGQQIPGQIGNQMQMGGQIQNQVGGGLGNQMISNMAGQMPGMQNQLSGGMMGSPMQNQLSGQLNPALAGQVPNAMHLQQRKGADGMMMNQNPNFAGPRNVTPNQFHRQSPTPNVQSPASIGGPPSNQMAQSPAVSLAPSPGSNLGSVPGQQRSIGMAPSPSSSLNTPGQVQPAPSPLAQSTPEEIAYRDKIRFLSKYTEPLRRMINQGMGGQDGDKLNKMKQLYFILSNPSKRTSMETLIKCEKVLERLDFSRYLGSDQPAPSPISVPTAAPMGSQKEHVLFHSLIEAMSATLQSPMANHTLQRTFGTPNQALFGSDIKLLPLPNKKKKVEEPPSDISEILQGEIARLDQRFKVSIDPAQQPGAKSVQLVCWLDDHHLPCVPPVSLCVPEDYPATPPRCILGSHDYSATSFLIAVQAALDARVKKLPIRYSVSQLLDTWEMSVRQASAPTHTPPTATTVLLGL